MVRLMIVLNVQKEANQNCCVPSGSPLISFGLEILIIFVIQTSTNILKRNEGIVDTLEIYQFAVFFNFISFHIYLFSVDYQKNLADLQIKLLIKIDNCTW